MRRTECEEGSTRDGRRMCIGIGRCDGRRRQEARGSAEKSRAGDREIVLRSETENRTTRNATAWW